eukprot:Lankesteria_metandrocarpae@DN7866_c0_g1_i1.p1
MWVRTGIDPCTTSTSTTTTGTHVFDRSAVTADHATAQRTATDLGIPHSAEGVSAEGCTHEHLSPSERNSTAAVSITHKRFLGNGTDNLSTHPPLRCHSNHNTGMSGIEGHELEGVVQHTRNCSATT